MTCTDCTLQWSYKAPGYGIIYQCSDISIFNGSEMKDCEGDCLNDGICQDGMCFCSAGYFGPHCEHHGKPNQFYEPSENNRRAVGAPMQFHEEIDSSGGLGFFGGYFLLLLISLLIAAIIFAVVYFMCRRDAEYMIRMSSEKDRLLKGDGQRRSDDPRSMEKEGQGPNRKDSERKMQDDKKLQDEKKAQEEKKLKEDKGNLLSIKTGDFKARFHANLFKNH